MTIVHGNHDSIKTLTAPVYLHHAGKEQSRERRPNPDIPEQDDSVQLQDTSVSTANHEMKKHLANDNLRPNPPHGGIPISCASVYGRHPGQSGSMGCARLVKADLTSLYE